MGRHDTFALACNAKYYEDMGYPGHVELLGQLQRDAHRLRDRQAEGLAGAQLLLQHGVQRGQRPGLRRALVPARRLRAPARDDRPRLRLVGVPGRHRSRERVEPHRRARARLLARASLQRRDRPPRHARGPAGPHGEDRVPSRIEALTKNLVEYNGYWLPSHFSNEGAIAEYWACRERAAIMDLSPLRKFEVLGPDAEALMQATITRDAAAARRSARSRTRRCATRPAG